MDVDDVVQNRPVWKCESRLVSKLLPVAALSSVAIWFATCMTKASLSWP